MNSAKSQLNNTALALEDAQTEIRVLVKFAWLNKLNNEQLYFRLKKIIRRAIAGITIVRLKADAIRSLNNFARSQLKLWRSIPMQPHVVAFLGTQASKLFPFKDLPTQADLRVLKGIKSLSGANVIKYDIAVNKGIPLSKFYKDVWEQDVKPTLDKIINEVAYDPNDFTGRNSLRNLAEMEVRYNKHLEEIAELKASGAKLVIASTHADCSKRCAPHQGKIYSLDHSYGVTQDGRIYEPLENATDIYYTTKAGRVYKNGLLGFNCRHRLSVFTGQKPLTISEKERKTEYAITSEQRRLERAVRKKRVEALMLKDINKNGYQKAKKQATLLYKQYQEFSHSNDRAYYPMRVKI